MAEYVRFRLAAAKVGASMALLALVAGAAEKAQASSNGAGASSAAQFLKLTGLTKTLSLNFSKIENKLLKIDTTIAGLQKNLARNYYKATQIDAKFLKITDANHKYLKIDDANAQFLKITDANGKFLQGKGAVLSNSLLLPAVQTGQQQVLLGDGSVRVLIALMPAGGPVVTLANDTNTSLNFTLIGGTAQSATVPAGGTTNITPSQGQMDIQMFGGGGGAGKVWTITLSNLSTQAGEQFVGQMLIGLL